LLADRLEGPGEVAQLLAGGAQDLLVALPVRDVEGRADDAHDRAVRRPEGSAVDLEDPAFPHELVADGLPGERLAVPDDGQGVEGVAPQELGDRLPREAGPGGHEAAAPAPRDHEVAVGRPEARGGLLEELEQPRLAGEA